MEGEQIDASTHYSSSSSTKSISPTLFHKLTSHSGGSLFIRILRMYLLNGRKDWDQNLQV